MTTSAPTEPPPFRGLSGRRVVVGMFAFAITVIVALYTYWHYHRAPFLSLQEALAAKFPESGPLVEGGQHKMHRDTPKILRVTMRVPFDPTRETERTARRTKAVREVVNSHPLPDDYDLFELNLFWPEPEAEIVQLQQQFPMGSATSD